MTTLLAAAALAVLVQQPDVTVDVKPSESISGVRQFHVKIASNDPVTQVEFYVGSELRDTDSSIPYEFRLDTIEEKDGNLQLTFAAYTTKGDSTKKIVNVKVDNGVGLGADVHVTKGIEQLQVSNWDDAIREARIALKASANDNRARMIMARAYLGKGQVDKAQKYAEDWKESEPTSSDAAELLSGIHMHRAFNTMSRGTDRDAALKSIQDAFKAAISTRQSLLQTKLEKIGSPTPDNLLTYADAAMKAGRFSLAISALEPEYRKRVDRSEVTNRLAYAQIRAGRVQDARQTLTQVEKLSKLDAYGDALMAVVQAIGHNQAASDRYMSEALLKDNTDLGVRTAQAYLALSGNKTFVLAKLAADLQQEAGQRPEVNYYLSALSYGLADFEEGRKYFRTAVLADPLAEEAYLEEGNNSLALAIKVSGAPEEKRFRAASAKAMFETALEVRPESYRGLLGLALTSLLTGESAEALRYAEAAAKSAPTQASVHYIHAAVLSANRRAPEAAKANQLAWKYDQKVLGGRSVPNGLEAWNYYFRNDRMPVVSPPR